MRFPTLLALLLTTAALSPLAAQKAPEAPSLDARVGKLEKQVKAVQRKVFPGADSRFFEAEIAPPVASAEPAAGVPATNPVNDLTARVDALESELRNLTGQVEQNGFKLRQLEEAIAKMRGDTDYRLNLLEGGAPKPAATPGAPMPPAGVAPTPKAAEPAVTAPAPAAAKPADPGEDAYNTGYRLWEGGKFTEAQTALEGFSAKYPKHRLTSRAQNLLGRAYLDAGQPAAAAEILYANYQKLPNGERAPDSLYYLGQALVALKNTKQACIVYAQVTAEYGSKISASLKEKVAKARAAAKCA